ncbi:MAG: GNAT family N-acetyltransferase [Planctomycetota bacterium]|nr:GNAT family N-acetyltransferase [Planctomycetota bacterium]
MSEAQPATPANSESPAPTPPPGPPPQLMMRRKTLDGLPPLTMGEGVSVRSLQPGDEAAWDRVVGGAFGWEQCAGKFESTMRSDPAFLPERVFFGLHNGVALATASAWNRPGEYGPEIGYLHYVAVQPGQTNRGMGTLVSLAALHKLKAEGRTSAVLHTDDFRLPAVFIYLRLGFAPLVTHESHRARWPEVFKNLQGRASVDLYREELSAPLFKRPVAPAAKG